MLIDESERKLINLWIFSSSRSSWGPVGLCSSPVDALCKAMLTTLLGYKAYPLSTLKKMPSFLVRSAGIRTLGSALGVETGSPYTAIRDDVESK